MDNDPLLEKLPKVSLEFIDHVVSNYKEGEMEKMYQFLADNFNMHRFWSVDDSVIHTEYSSLKSIVMASPNERVLLPSMNQQKGGKSLKFKSILTSTWSNPGSKHIALRTNDIIASVTAMRARGVKFLVVPDAYYDDLKERLVWQTVVYTRIWMFCNV